jgi:hypothetical protein
MIATIDRLTDEDLKLGPHDPKDLRAYFHDWAADLADR